MDWTKLFFSPEGRIGRQTYWIGILVLFAVHVLLGWTGIAWLVATYSWIVISIKRFHDMGKSGWLTAIPVVAGIVVPFAAIFAVAGSAIISGVSGAGEEMVAAAVLSALGGAVLVLLASGFICLGFLIWQGVAESQSGDNRYGPAPATAIA